MECKICVSKKEFLIENTHKKKSRNSLIFSTSLTKVSSNQHQIDPQIQLERTHAHKCCTASPCLVRHLYSLQLCLLDSAYPFFSFSFLFFCLVYKQATVGECILVCERVCVVVSGAQGCIFLPALE